MTLQDHVGQQVKTITHLGDGLYFIDFYTMRFITNRKFSCDWSGRFYLH